MKKSIITLSLLACASSAVFASDYLSARSACDKDVPRLSSWCKKNTCAATPISCPTIIKKSGCYCLTRDIVGTIIIDADNVTLDLNCHLVDGDGQVAGITVANHVDVTIKNGAVTNKDSLGISATDCAGVIIEDVQVYGSNQALVMTRCNNSQVSTVKAYDNFNTSGAVVLVDDCENVQLDDVQANNNIKELTASVGTTNPAIGILTVNNSDHVSLINCSTNTNTRTNNNARFAPLAILFSFNTTITNCTSNGNTVPVDDIRAFVPVHVAGCSDVIIDKCQVNANTLQSTASFFRALYVLNTPRIIIKNSQVNDNFVGILNQPAGNFNSDMNGIVIFQNEVLEDNIISNCQVCRNTANSGAPGATNRVVRGINISAASDTLNISGRTTIEYCQVNSNSFTIPATNQESFGIQILRCQDLTITECNADGHFSGAITTGILVEGFPTGLLRNPCRNVRVINCTANNNTGASIGVGIGLVGFQDSTGSVLSACENCVVINSQANRNISDPVSGFSAGISFERALGCSIIDCQTDSNSGHGIYAGQVAADNLQPENFNNSIINCSAKENGINGFELSITGSTTNDNFLIQGCIALANAGTGFLHENNVLTSRYLSNYAKDNGTNFDINGGEIQLFSLDINGTYSHVSGDVNHFSALVNIDGL